MTFLNYYTSLFQERTSSKIFIFFQLPFYFNVNKKKDKPKIFVKIIGRFFLSHGERNFEGIFILAFKFYFNRK